MQHGGKVLVGHVHVCGKPCADPHPSCSATCEADSSVRSLGWMRSDIWGAVPVAYCRYRAARWFMSCGQRAPSIRSMGCANLWFGNTHCYMQHGLQCSCRPAISLWHLLG